MSTLPTLHKRALECSEAPPPLCSQLPLSRFRPWGHQSSLAWVSIAVFRGSTDLSPAGTTRVPYP